MILDVKYQYPKSQDKQRSNKFKTISDCYLSSVYPVSSSEMSKIDTPKKLKDVPMDSIDHETYLFKCQK